MTESEILTEMDDLPLTRRKRYVLWYLEHRIAPASVLIFGILFINGVTSPSGKMPEAEFTGTFMMVFGALAWEAVRYQPWRDAT